MKIVNRDLNELPSREFHTVRLALSDADALKDVDWDTAITEDVSVEQLIGAFFGAVEQGYEHNILFNGSAVPEIAEYLTGYLIHNPVLTCDNCSMPETASSRVEVRRIPHAEGVIERKLCDGCDTKIREIIADQS